MFSKIYEGNFYGSPTNYLTSVISKLDRVFRLSLTEVIKQGINRLHRRKISGDELFTELTILYQRHNMADLKKHQHKSSAQSESYAKVICSASFI